ncbi:hypothetical protein A2305_00340 [Candidatus Curtissbacteria bacterium RIFOXYB2_FULL_41_10]|nr:MAG: hypothetical protein A2305_00340 [Candidatus Curtissbacteria bacterium RIFOXYB2_FULL_41_10]
MYDAKTSVKFLADTTYSLSYILFADDGLSVNIGGGLITPRVRADWSRYIYNSNDLNKYYSDMVARVTDHNVYGIRYLITGFNYGFKNKFSASVDLMYPLQTSYNPITIDMYYTGGAKESFEIKPQVPIIFRLALSCHFNLSEIFGAFGRFLG